MTERCVFREQVKALGGDTNDEQLLDLLCNLNERMEQSGCCLISRQVIVVILYLHELGVFAHVKEAK